MLPEFAVLSLSTSFCRFDSCGAHQLQATCLIRLERSVTTMPAGVVGRLRAILRAICARPPVGDIARRHGPRGSPITTVTTVTSVTDDAKRRPSGGEALPGTPVNRHVTIHSRDFFYARRESARARGTRGDEGALQLSPLSHERDMTARRGTSHLKQAIPATARQVRSVCADRPACGTVVTGPAKTARVFPSLTAARVL
jgi:hypothetical protein